jgi:DNA/RNA endonuclease G (NUC1)
MKKTFVFSNAVPQVQNGFNGGIWKELEEHVQDFARSLDEEKAIYVITGPVDLPPDGSETVIAADQNSCPNEIRLAGLDKLRKRAICDANDKQAGNSCVHGVAVPSGLFKIIYVPFLERAFGFLLSNEDHRKIKSRGISNADYFEKWRASIDVIEDAANLDFFPGKSRRWRNVHEQTCTLTRWRQ